jgi:hypothetical protein
MDFSEYAAVQAQVHADGPPPPLTVSDASWLIASLVLACLLLVLGLDGR